MVSLRSVGLALTWLGLCVTGAAFLLVASAFSPWGVWGGAAHPTLDLVQFVIAWGYLLGTPLVAGAALLLGRGSRRMARSNTAVLAAWLLVFVASLFVHA